MLGDVGERVNDLIGYVRYPGLLLMGFFQEICRPVPPDSSVSLSQTSVTPATSLLYAGFAEDTGRRETPNSLISWPEKVFACLRRATCLTPLSLQLMPLHPGTLSGTPGEYLCCDVVT